MHINIKAQWNKGKSKQTKSSQIPRSVYDVGKIRDLSTFSCGGLRFRKEEEFREKLGLFMGCVNSTRKL